MLIGGLLAKTECMSHSSTDPLDIAPDAPLILTGAKARDDINRQRFIIRRMLRQMAAKEHEMEREAIAFAIAEQRAKEAIEDNWRVEHWGKEPLRPPAWQSRPET
jgi:hypothetical protein